MSLFARRANNPWQEAFSIGYDEAGASATAAVKLMSCQRAMRIDRVEIDIPAGYTGDAANYYTIALKKGSTVIAQWSTLTSAQGTIAADTFVNLINSATDANLVTTVGDVISVSFTKTASAVNLPAGRIVMHGRYVA